MSDDRYKGKEIIKLFKMGLDTEPLVDSVTRHYESAEGRMVNETDTAISLCNAALERLKDSTELSVPFSRGVFYLLLASIYLNENSDLKLAEENFLLSKDEFSSRQLSHLEALAYLGFAITQRKLDDLKAAIVALDRAKTSASLESIYSVKEIALNALREAIEEENSHISDYFTPQVPQQEAEPIEKQLSVYNISASQGCVTAGGTADLNLLSLGDYKYNTPLSPEITIDLIKCPDGKNADYILEVDAEVNQVKDGLNKGDWLLIKAKNTLNSLTGRRVAILTREDDEILASLKTFAHAEDHYFLKAQSKDDASIVIAGYKSQNLSKISDYYEGYGKIKKRYAYDVYVSGEVIKHIPRATIKDVTKPIVWRIPILSDIAAGVGKIAENKVEDYWDFLQEDECKDVDFGVKVVGISMTDDNIFPGDIALIHQQPTVKNKEIAAVVIFTPDKEHLGVLKRYYTVYEKRDDSRHWLLESSNPTQEHLVIMPSNVDVETIEKLYLKKVEEGKIVTPKFYRDAEIAIAGKFVRTIRKTA